MNTKDVPILLMLFNRPEHTRKVFEKVRELKPSRLFVAGNGPRSDVPKDIELCKSVQNIFKEVDWECELHTNFNETNIGMNPQWYKALDWFFQFVEKGIILEDDCVPHPSFFSYCNELLTKYANDEQIMHINGSNFQFGQKRGDASYYFSKYTHVWGWATWKRAWQKYDFDLKSFPGFKQNNVVDTICPEPNEKKYFMTYFERLYSKENIDSATKWLYSIWNNKGICITPNVNLITNIGYGLSAGNTIFKEKTMDQRAFDIMPLIHPISHNVDIAADKFTFKTVYMRSFFEKVRYKVMMWVSQILK